MNVFQKLYQGNYNPSAQPPSKEEMQLYINSISIQKELEELVVDEKVAEKISQLIETDFKLINCKSSNAFQQGVQFAFEILKT